MGTKQKTADGFSEEERAAIKERAAEVKSETRRGRRKAKKADGESDVLAKIAEMDDDDRRMAEQLHALIKSTAPSLTARTWYGMPAYAKDGKVVCFFQAAKKFKTRYATLGFSDTANLDDGDIWPTSYALNDFTPAVAAKVTQLIEQALG